jgi:hypothetical protein
MTDMARLMTYVRICFLFMAFLLLGFVVRAGELAQVPLHPVRRTRSAGVRRMTGWDPWQSAFRTRPYGVNYHGRR